MRVIVGMSGGVDSSVAALLLKQQGFTVEGLFMKNWEEDDTDEHCTATQDIADAQAVCDSLEIPLYKVNFATEYWDNVFTYFLQEYQAGRTPNPDILCNTEIKFKAFLEYAKSLGADAIATGHYAIKEKTGDLFSLHKGVDNNKDQSYFLHALNQMQLKDALFPLGNLTKPKVREIAAQAGFINQSKKDSTGICFIGERRFKDFLAHYLPAKPGDIVTTEGKVIGQHHGLMFHTIGQREGLGIGGMKASSGEPWFVVSKNLQKNQLIVVQGTNSSALYQSYLLAFKPTWIAGSAPEFPFVCKAKIRYRQADQDCVISINPDSSLRVDFHTLQRAVTPGQSIVFYSGTECLGGAIICEAYGLLAQQGS